MLGYGFCDSMVLWGVRGGSKYPAAGNADSIIRTLVSYAQSDGGDIKIINRNRREIHAKRQRVDIKKLTALPVRRSFTYRDRGR